MYSRKTIYMSTMKSTVCTSRYIRVVVYCLVTLTVLNITSSTLTETCNSTDVGAMRCVQSSTVYQWESCLTNKYIQQQSRGQHTCPDSVTTCWYPCSTELSGSTAVLQKCTCTAEQPIVHPPASNQSCISPAGDDCSWYSSCVTDMYPCKNITAVKYALKFCKMYSQICHVCNKFSPNGTQWINAVRRCLQVALVPPMRNFSSAEHCHDVIDNTCYTSPYPGAPSICSLTSSQFGSVLWTLKRNLERTDWNLLHVLEDMHNVRVNCGSQVGLLSDVERLIRVTAQVNGTGEDEPSKPRRVCTFEVADKAASKLQWTEHKHYWIGFKSNTNGSSDLMDIDILVTEKAAYELRSPWHPPLNMDNVVSKFAEAVQEGRMLLRVDGAVVYVVGMKGCRDVWCTDVTVNATAPLQPVSGTVSLTCSVVQRLFVLFVSSVISVIVGTAKDVL